MNPESRAWRIVLILIVVIGASWLLLAQGHVAVLAWIGAIYLAGGPLTALAIALMLWTQPRTSLPPRPGDRRRHALTMLKVFALWPGVILMAAVFAVITIAQKFK